MKKVQGLGLGFGVKASGSRIWVSGLGLQGLGLKGFRL